MTERKKVSRVEVAMVDDETERVLNFLINRAMGGGVTREGEAMTMIVSEVETYDRETGKLVDVSDWTVKLTKGSAQ